MSDHARLAGEDPIVDKSAPTDGVGLCLSGGGYRAMLFHVGALWRLMEAGKLLGITRISSVASGSITAGVLALAWPELRSGGMAAFLRKVVAPLRGMAGTTIDQRSVLGGMVRPGTIGSYVAGAYARHLFADKERLINWGYAVSDAGIRTYWDSAVPPPAAFPYPQVGIG